MDQSTEHDQDPKQMITSFDESVGANMTLSDGVSNDMYAYFPTVVAPLMPGGYISLLLGVDQEASATLKLHFDEAQNLIT
ncbi:hypothetical protein PAHAL_9G130700 [Panicum hallii]|uniref:Uncharacterized protein n=1 Tax=Panicum hallii TaxID=206008 RepID=A0A2T8I120_9POAL|nr:hypothetical protein PAHAL_9G130700 [Panicum hallii]